MTIAHTVTQTLTGTPQGHKATLRAGVCVCVWSSLQWWTCETPVLLIARIPAAFSPGLHPYRPLQYGVCSNFCLHPTVNTSSVLIILMLLLRLISKCMCVWVRDRDRKRYRKTDKWGAWGWKRPRDRLESVTQGENWILHVSAYGLERQTVAALLDLRCHFTSGDSPRNQQNIHRSLWSSNETQCHYLPSTNTLKFCKRACICKASRNIWIMKINKHTNHIR